MNVTIDQRECAHCGTEFVTSQQDSSRFCSLPCEKILELHMNKMRDRYGEAVGDGGQDV